MPITPETQPLQLPQSINEAQALSQIKPSQGLPIRQIAQAGQRIGKRVVESRDALHDLQSQIAEQQIDPRNVDTFANATQGIRERINQIASSENIHQQLPAIRREARKFAEVTSRFNQNREAVQESLKNLQDTEVGSVAHRNFLESKIQGGAKVQLNEEGLPDPSSISTVQNFQDATHPSEFLQDRMSKIRSITLRDNTPGNGVLIEKERKFRGKSRLIRQGLKELNFGLIDPEEGLKPENLRQGRETVPEVQRWLNRQQQLHAASIAQKLRDEGVDPESEEFQNKLRKRTQTAIGDDVIRMVRDAATRNISGDQAPEITFKSIPGANTRRDQQNSKEFQTSTRAGHIATDQTEGVRNFIQNEAIKKRVKPNPNITMDQYRELRRRTSLSNESSIATAMGGVGSGPAMVRGQGPFKQFSLGSAEGVSQEIQNKFSPETIAAFNRIHGEEEDLIEKSTEVPAYGFPDDTDALSLVSQNIASLSTDRVSSSQLDQEELRALIANENNFSPTRVTTRGNGLLVEVKPRKEYPGMDDTKVGEPIAIRIPKQANVFGTQENTRIDNILSTLTPDIAQRMSNKMAIGDTNVTGEWTEVDPGIDVKIDHIPMDEVSLDAATTPVYYASRHDGKQVTFANLGEKADGLNKDQSDIIMRNMVQAAMKRKETSTALEEIRQFYDEELKGRKTRKRVLSKAIVDWFNNRSSLSGEKREAVKKLVTSSIPATDPGQAAAWANQMKQLSNRQ